MADPDRSEAPTQRRLDRARGEGRVAVSRELAVAACLGALAALLHFHGGAGLGAGALGPLGGMMRHATDPDFGASVQAAWRGAGTAGLAIAAPFVVVGALAGPCATLLQTRALVAPALLAPDLGRISPASGLRRVFGRGGVQGAVAGAAKLAMFAALVWYFLPGRWAGLTRLLAVGPAELTEYGWQVAGDAVLAAALAQAAWAGLDLLISHRRHRRDLSMTREEVRQEARDANGNPEIKARIRRLRVQRARRRMLRDVARATMVVTNPTHYAVALSYDEASRAAPRVVAKGVDEMAARIRAAAAQHGVAMVANPPLARALYRVELEAEIPPELYKAVAELVAYVWKLRRPARRLA